MSRMLGSLRIINMCHQLYDFKRFSIVFACFAGKYNDEMNSKEKTFNIVSDTVEKAEMVLCVVRI